MPLAIQYIGRMWHFTGQLPATGESQEQMQPILQRLHDNGIGSILDYAAEVRGLAHLFDCKDFVMRLEFIPRTGQGVMCVSQLLEFGATLYPQHYTLIGCFCSSVRPMMMLFTNDLCL